MNADSSSLHLRLERHKNRRVIDEGLRRLKAATDCVVDNTRLLASDNIREMRQLVVEGLREPLDGTRTIWSTNARSELFDHISTLCRIWLQKDAILFWALGNYVEGISIPADCVLLNADAVWKIVSRDLQLISTDKNYWLNLEFNYYNATEDYVREGAFELTVSQSLS